MAFRKGGNKFEGRRPAGNDRPRYGDRAGPPRASRGPARSASSLPLVDVTCDKCGRPTQVPFKPTGDRPVYCRDCFHKGSDNGPRAEPRKTFSSDPSSSELREIHEKLDKIMRALDIE
jgi:CxxC-x17-CxxC domain-containing protein